MPSRSIVWQSVYHSGEPTCRLQTVPYKEILIHKRKYSSCLIVKRRFLLRDTFAGKILTEIWRPENISEKLSNFYRQKCRAT